MDNPARCVLIHRQNSELWRRPCDQARPGAAYLFNRTADGDAGSPPTARRPGVGNIVQVLVRDNNVDQALRALKKKMQREGVFREMKLRRNYEKPSEKRAREKAEAVRRSRKLLRKRLEREGY